MDINLEQAIETDKAKVMNALTDMGYAVDVGTGEGNYFRTPYVVNPSANNEDYKWGAGLYCSASLLSYCVEREYVTIPWMACSFSVEYDKELKYPEDEPRVRDIVRWVLDNIGHKLPWKMFHDEDAYAGYCSHRIIENIGAIKFTFYVNPDIPKGYWENHTL